MKRKWLGNWPQKIRTQNKLKLTVQERTGSWGSGIGQACKRKRKWKGRAKKICRYKRYLLKWKAGKET